MFVISSAASSFVGCSLTHLGRRRHAFLPALNACNTLATNTATSTEPSPPAARLKFLERFVNTKSRPLHITQAGHIGPNGQPSERRTLLFICGTTGTAYTDFRMQLAGLPALLPADWSLVAFDSPGRGKSIQPDDTVMPLDYFQLNARVAGELMDALGVHQYSVLGWSGGASSAMILAKDRPECVESITCFGTPTQMCPKTLQYYEYIRITGKWPEELRKPFEDEIGADNLQRIWSETIDGLKEVVKQRPNNDVCNYTLPHIRCPTLLVHGSDDPMVSTENQERVCREIENCELVQIKGGKHNAHLQFSDEFNEHVANFLLKTVV